jgi:dUTP pyrophosphatase
MSDVKIYCYKTTTDAVVPEVAYGGTSACFDITCTTSTVIPAGDSAVVPNGLRLVIDQNDKYYMRVNLRSSKGFKYSLLPHYGIIDAGYTGDLGVKIFNVGDSDIKIEAGERYAQIEVLKIPTYSIIELDEEQFNNLVEKQHRGEGGFGSSGK